MRPPELETKLETGAFGPDVLYTRYGDSPANAVCIAPRTMPTAPGDAPEIVKRLGLYPDLVEAVEALAFTLNSTPRSGAVCWCDPHVDAIGHSPECDTLRFLFARCKEVPK